MLEAILKEHGGDLLSSMIGSGGLDSGQAERLLPPALEGIGGALGDGGLDLGDLLGGGEGAVGALLGKLDIGAIASSAGLGSDETLAGLTSLIPVVVSLLSDKVGGGAGAEGLMSMLSGGDGSDALGAIGGLAGKLFGK